MNQVNGLENKLQKNLIFRAFKLVVLGCIMAIFALPVSHSYSLTIENPELPVLMYHHVVPGESTGTTSPVTILTSKLERDMAYLAENKYTALLPMDLLDIRDGKRKMPERPVVITFDDGYESDYTQAFPLLKKYELKASFFVIVSTVDNPARPGIKKLTWAQAKEMYESGYADIQSHSYNLHNAAVQGVFDINYPNGIKKFPGETTEEYILRVEPDVENGIRLIEENVGNKVISFTYPYGVYEEDGRNLLEKHGICFAFNTVHSTANFNGNLFSLNRYAIGPNTELSTILPGLPFDEKVFKGVYAVRRDLSKRGQGA